MFLLAPQLATDTVAVGDLPLSSVLLMNDRQFPWLVLVPRREGVCEAFELTEVEQHQLAVESNAVAKLMARLFQADKMNVAALGNVVSQLHVHHIARFKTDPVWPKPVWGQLPYHAYELDELEAQILRVRNAFATAEMTLVYGSEERFNLKK